MLPDDVKPDETVSDSKDETQKTIAKVSAALPEATALARLEARQLAFVENLTRYADRRSAAAEKAIRRLGLDPRRDARRDPHRTGRSAAKLSTSRDGSLDPRFDRLGASLARMDALERGLDGIPQVMPADYQPDLFGLRLSPRPVHRRRGDACRPRFPRPAAAPRSMPRRTACVSFVGQISGLRQRGRDPPRQRPDDPLCPYVAVSSPRRAPGSMPAT